ncbi:MAG TPA: hypothetical protein VHJ69_03995, partial [Gemmatimonadales bacterium]|nr:hypothetical protein [Gemmatimonadales bacterium]
MQQLRAEVSRFITGAFGQADRVGRGVGRDRQPVPHRVKRFAGRHAVPVLKLKGPDPSRWDDRKLDHVRPYLQRAEAERRFGVVATVAGQEYAWVFSARTHRRGKALWFESSASSAASASTTSTSWTRTSRRRSSRSARTSRFPRGCGSTANGHAWAKRQADHAGLPYTALSNGFAA